MNKTLTLNYIVKPIKFEKINDEFTKCHCYIMALGKNRNYSYFTKEAVQNALPTLFDIPVVAHIKVKADGTPYVGAHDRQLIIDDDGTQLIDQTYPFGLVPEGSNPTFEDITEIDGTVATYLTADIILWSGRYPIMDAKSDDPSTYFNQSMEIIINSYESLAEDNNYMNITDFTFSALCLLGRDEHDPEYNSEPCFPSAKVTPLQYNLNDNFKKEFSLMMSKFKKISKKESEQGLDKKEEILKKYNITADKLNFKIDALSVEDLDKKLKDFTDAHKTQPKSIFSTTYNQKRDALRNALDSDVTLDADGNVVSEIYYYVMDFDDQYAYVEKDSWDNAGNFDETHGRYTYTFDDKTLTATITSDFEEMILTWLTVAEKATLDVERGNYSKLQTEFEEYKKNYSTSEKDVEELRSYKNQKVADEHQASVNAIFAKSEFESLKDNKEFNDFKANVGDMSLEDIETKCFAIYGKAQAQGKVNFSANKPVEKVPVVVKVDQTPSVDSSPYGGLFEEYKDK